MRNKEIYDRIQDLLLSVQKPARYTGGELNVATPEVDSPVRAAISYPDLYEVGMANNGINILYNAANSMEGVACERVFAVAPEFENVLRENSIPLYTLESYTPLGELDLLGFNLSHELLYTNVLQIIDLGGIPLLRKERGESDPLIIAGGEASSNPFPGSDFIDLFFIGDGEEGFREILQVLKKCKEEALPREETIKRISGLQGVLNPENYSFTYDGLSVKGEGFSEVQKIKHDAVFSDKEKPVVPNIRISQERAIVEVSRGCFNLCKFCHAGYYNLPYRPCTPADVSGNLEKNLSNTGYNEVTLTALSVSDYRHLVSLLNEILPGLTERGISISLPSLKIDKNTLPVIEVLSKIRRPSLTFAVESASEELRSISNKKVKTEDILEIVDFVFSRGWRLIKFYFMIGLPGCDEVDEAEEISALIKKILTLPGKGKREINVTLSPFVPKPHTPFQWAEQKGMDYCDEVILKVKRSVPRSVKVKNHDTRSSFLEGLFSRGDEKLGKLIIDAYENGARFDSWSEYFNFNIWKASIEKTLPHWEGYFSERDENLFYPWQVIRTGNEKAVDAMKSRKMDLDSYDQPVDRYGSKIDESRLESAMEKFMEKYETLSRLRFEFEKTGIARFIPHIDLMEIVKRALRMSEFPMAFTQGFNKREKISAGFPVPLGVESLSEIFEIESYQEIDDHDLGPLVDRVNSHLPEDINLKRVTLKEGKTALMAEITSVDYEIEFKEDNDSSSFIESFNEISEFTKTNKKGKVISVAKSDSVLSCQSLGNRILISLSTGGASSMRIDNIISRVLDVEFETVKGIRIVKTAQYSGEGVGRVRL